MKKELYLFEGKKVVAIDYELYKCYEIFVDEFSDRKMMYLSYVLDLTEDMSEKELAERISEAIYEEIYMRTLMEDDLIVAMKKMLAEANKEIKVVEGRNEMPEEIKELLDSGRVVKMTIYARNDSFISQLRIEKGFACLYKAIKCSDLAIWVEKKVENDIAKELNVIVEENKVSELMDLIRNYVYMVFGQDEPERVIGIYVQ